MSIVLKMLFFKARSNTFMSHCMYKKMLGELGYSAYPLDKSPVHKCICKTVRMSVIICLYNSIANEYHQCIEFGLTFPIRPATLACHELLFVPLETTSTDRNYCMIYIRNSYNFIMIPFLNSLLTLIQIENK